MSERNIEIVHSPYCSAEEGSRAKKSDRRCKNHRLFSIFNQPFRDIISNRRGINMGHQRLGKLPKTRRWQQVVELVGSGAAVAEVAAATAASAEQQMSQAGNDSAIGHSFWLLTQIVVAARAPDFSHELRTLGLLVERPTLLKVVSEMVSAIDRYIGETSGPTDLGEIAVLSAAESLCAVASQQSNDLFGASAERTRNTLAGLATVQQFPTLAREFFTRFTRRQLTYFLSRELSQHVGSQSRFHTTREHQRFEEAIDRHCREASRIIKEFSGQWLRRRLIEGDLGQDQTQNFVHVAFKKIRAELEKRRVPDVAAA